MSKGRLNKNAFLDLEAQEEVGTTHDLDDEPDDADADEDGNLKGFVVPENEEDDEAEEGDGEGDEEDGEEEADALHPGQMFQESTNSGSFMDISSIVASMQRVATVPPMEKKTAPKKASKAAVAVVEEEEPPIPDPEDDPALAEIQDATAPDDEETVSNGEERPDEEEVKKNKAKKAAFTMVKKRPRSTQTQLERGDTIMIKKVQYEVWYLGTAVNSDCSEDEETFYSSVSRENYSVLKTVGTGILVSFLLDREGAIHTPSKTQWGKIERGLTSTGKIQWENLRALKNREKKEVTELTPQGQTRKIEVEVPICPEILYTNYMKSKAARSKDTKRPREEAVEAKIATPPPKKAKTEATSTPTPKPVSAPTPTPKPASTPIPKPATAAPAKPPVAAVSGAKPLFSKPVTKPVLTIKESLEKHANGSSSHFPEELKDLEELVARVKSEVPTYNPSKGPPGVMDIRIRWFFLITEELKRMLQRPSTTRAFFKERIDAYVQELGKVKSIGDWQQAIKNQLAKPDVKEQMRSRFWGEIFTYPDILEILLRAATPPPPKAVSSHEEESPEDLW